jgi:hypothetical protein
MQEEQEKELIEHAKAISKSLSCIEDKKLPQKIADLNRWLIEERHDISNENEWKKLIYKLNSKVTIPTTSNYDDGYTFRAAHWHAIICHLLKVQPDQKRKRLLKDINEILYDVDVEIEDKRAFLGIGNEREPFFTKNYFEHVH